jgi:hypothetical protein
MIAHVRTHIQFYFFLVSALSLSIFFRFDDIPKQAVWLFVIMQGFITYTSSHLSIVEKGGWIGMILSIAHFAVLLLYFQRLWY